MFLPLNLDYLPCNEEGSTPFHGHTGPREYVVDMSMTTQVALLIYVLPHPRAYRNIFVRLNIGTRLIHVITFVHRGKFVVGRSRETD